MADWTPTELGATVVAWFDANMSSTITLASSGSNAGKVTAWASRVGGITATLANYRYGGNNNSVSTSTPVAPKYSATIRNNRPAVYCDGASGLESPLCFSLPPTFPVNTADSAMIAAYTPTAAAYNDVVGYGVTPGYADFNTLKGKVRAIYWTSSRYPGSSLYYTDNDLVDGRQTTPRDVTVYGEFIGGTSFNARSDGGTATAFYKSTNATYTTNGGGGGYLFGVTNNPVGHIQEWLVFNRLITLDERQRCEGYIAWKWGTQANLPAAHPYKSSAPQTARRPIRFARFS